MPRVGGEFAGYRIESLIGHGGMSIVYRAQHIRLERTVALKLLMPELSADAAFQERFMRESRLAAQLDHPNVIPVYEAGDQDGVFYIAMRYVPGSTLKQLLDSAGALTLQRTTSIVGQVASALHAAHEQKGLVHRDVKPANILVLPSDAEDESDHVYLSDFGIAKQRHAGALTKTGMFVGTADYAAPEQIEGRELDRRADVYALGCVLYECLTGAPTYQKDSEVALMYAHLLEPPPVPTQARPELPPEIDAVVAKAMAKSRDERYSTTRELATDMRRVLRGTASHFTQAGGTVAAIPPPQETFVPRSAPTDAPASPAAAPTPSAPGTVSPPSPSAGGPAAAPEPAPPAGPRRRGGRGKWVAAAVAAVALIGGVIAAVLLLAGGNDNGTSGDSLLDVLVPTEVASACTPLNTPHEGAVETDICEAPATALASFPDHLELSFYPSTSKMLSAYSAELNESGVTTDSGRCDRTQWKGEGTWRHASTGVFGGHRVCYLNGNGDAVIAWTHDKRGSANHVDMLAVASETSRGGQTSLFSWWNPLHEVIGKCRAHVTDQACDDTINQVVGT